MAETADVIIIGGGIHGASLAFHLTRRGLRPLVLERRFVAAGATGRSSGLVRMHYDLEPEFGAGLVVLSNLPQLERDRRRGVRFHPHRVPAVRGTGPRAAVAGERRHASAARHPQPGGDRRRRPALGAGVLHRRFRRGGLRAGVRLCRPDRLGRRPADGGRAGGRPPGAGSPGDRCRDAGGPGPRRRDEPGLVRGSHRRQRRRRLGARGRLLRRPRPPDHDLEARHGVLAAPQGPRADPSDGHRFHQPDVLPP